MNWNKNNKDKIHHKDRDLRRNLLISIGAAIIVYTIFEISLRNEYVSNTTQDNKLQIPNAQYVSSFAFDRNGEVYRPNSK